VGPGTPCGELMRRYWQPVGLVPELTDETPTKFVRVLGEDLVLFRDKSGRVGLLADHCAHRGASLLYGRVEERGIACAYHGWLYDVNGNCLECPAEPADSHFCLTVKQRAYPVQEYCGLYWAYLGPLPAPILPRIDIAEQGVPFAVGDVPPIECNWLQFVENNLDQCHVFILHQDTARLSQTIPNTTRGIIDMLATLDYYEDPNGIVRKQVFKNGYTEVDLLVFPNNQRIENQFSVKVAVDDTHCRNYRVFVDPLRTPESNHGADGKPLEYWLESSAEAKTPGDQVHPYARYKMSTVRYQDFTILETQGAISPRENEHLATSDRGIVLLRNILRREIAKVQQGVDPIGVIRDPAQAVINTHPETLMDNRPRWLTPNGVRMFADREPAAVG
jgi:5,5'-dehydrodivanillate O-demethylase oxygenase subunit